MLTGKMLRVRYAKDRIIPHYLDLKDPVWQEIGERLLMLFRGQEGRTRGELEQDRRDMIGDDPSQLVHQGLAKLLEDRCDFETVSGHPPEEVRGEVFRVAAERRKAATIGRPFDRTAVLAEAGAPLALSPVVVD